MDAAALRSSTTARDGFCGGFQTFAASLGLEAWANCSELKPGPPLIPVTVGNLLKQALMQNLQVLRSRSGPVVPQNAGSSQGQQLQLPRHRHSTDTNLGSERGGLPAQSSRVASRPLFEGVDGPLLGRKPCKKARTQTQELFAWLDFDCSGYAPRQQHSEMYLLSACSAVR